MSLYGKTKNQMLKQSCSLLVHQKEHALCMLSRVTMLVSTSVSAAVKSAAFAAEKLVH
jgi:hypothetical protein